MIIDVERHVSIIIIFFIIYYCVVVVVVNTLEFKGLKQRVFTRINK